MNKAIEAGILIFSDETLTELNQVLLRSKFDRYIHLDDRLEFVSRLEMEGKLIEVKSNFTDCRDKNDNKFLNLAFDSNSLCIVTGDSDLLDLNPFQGIQIINAATFLNDFII